MARTAEEIYSRKVSFSCKQELYGFHGIPDWGELFNRYMIFRLLGDEEVDKLLTEDEKSELEGVIVLK